KGLILQEGSGIAIISTGNVLPVAMECAHLLKKSNIGCRVISLPTVKPLDTTLLAETIRACQCLVTLEEHSLQGGLGGSIAEWLTEQPHQGTRLVRIGTPDRFLHQVGSQSYARQQCGLEPNHIVSRFLESSNQVNESATP
ncbi:MAG: hypothetical protein KDA84_07870, partial [Planctomycetaceae bacterium]|nr:hypothetical protein [Planctomycetaceae bacterium]